MHEISRMPENPCEHSPELLPELDGNNWTAQTHASGNTSVHKGDNNHIVQNGRSNVSHIEGNLNQTGQDGDENKSYIRGFESLAVQIGTLNFSQIGEACADVRNTQVYQYGHNLTHRLPQSITSIARQFWELPGNLPQSIQDAPGHIRDHFNWFIDKLKGMGKDTDRPHEAE